MADTSPEWKKPSDVMKLRRRKSLCSNLQTARTVQSSGLSLETCPVERKAQKRKNPFACLSSSEKTRDNDEDTEVRDSDGIVGVVEMEVNRAAAVPASSCLIGGLVRRCLLTFLLLCC